MARNLVQLRDELLSGAYRPGAYRTFTIYEPCRRFISAAPYRDRVVHHALCNVIEPIFERSFIFDSYANLIGKGTHRALDRCTHYARRHRYVFQGDIRLFFPSIDHQILLGRLARRIRDQRVLDLAGLILDHSNPQPPAEFYFPGDNLFTPFERRRGLPIGNLTSQFWSNVYLNPFDWFVKRELGCRAYLRYVDDFALFGDSKRELWQWREAIIEQLACFRLTIHEEAAQVTPVECGISWLGFVVYPSYRKVRRQNVVSFRRRLKNRAIAYRSGEIGFEELNATVQGWTNHVRYADTWGLRRRILSSHAL